MKKFFSILLVLVMILGYSIINVEVKAAETLEDEKTPVVRKIYCEDGKFIVGKKQKLVLEVDSNDLVQCKIFLHNKGNDEWIDILKGYSPPFASWDKFEIELPYLVSGENEIKIWLKSFGKKLPDDKEYEKRYMYKFKCYDYIGQAYDMNLESNKSEIENQEVPFIHNVVYKYDKLVENNRQVLNVFSKGFEEVQYKTVIINKDTKEEVDVLEGYSDSIQAQDIFELELPKLKKGDYKINLYIRRKNEEIKNDDYDSMISFSLKCFEKNDLSDLKTKKVKSNYEIGDKIHLEFEDASDIKGEVTVKNLLTQKVLAENIAFENRVILNPKKSGSYLVKMRGTYVDNNETKEFNVNKIISVGKIFEKKEEPEENNEEIKDTDKREVIPGKEVYLTFDDGPSTTVTPEILKVLKKYDIKATFFVVGQFVDYNSEILKQVNEEGHCIGNHTYSHDYSTVYASDYSIIKDIEKNDDAIKRVIPSYNKKLFRFPGGTYGKNKSYLEAVKSNGYTYFDWNIDCEDTKAYLVEAYKIVEAVKRQAKGKDKIIVLMHDAPVKTTTAEALPDIIEYFIEEGYEFKTLDNYTN